MKSRLYVPVLMALFLAACSGGGENSITGTFDNVLSGQIVAAGALSEANIAAQDVTAQAGGPVSGVEVRARGTGVSAVSDSNGRFSLVGLPSTVELTFTRSDGINASAHVDVKNNPVVTVELQKNSAVVIPNGQGKREIEGTITAVSDTEITVRDASTKTDVTALIVPGTTVIRHGNTILTASQLHVNDRVHVRALIGPDGALTALEIKLQNPADDNGDANPQKELEGLVRSISATEIVVADASSHADVTAKINGETKIRKGNTTIPWDAIKVNDRVHVKTRKEGADLIALEIRLQNPA